jgi:predicted DNA-binding protein with PD1-like motif
MKVFGLLLLSALGLSGQVTHREVTKATTPQDDAKPNSGNVPDVYAVNSRFERVVILRFKYETDLLAGFEKMVAKEKIANAVILSGAGSVRNYHIHSVSNRTFPSKNMYVQDPTAPADIVSMNGYVIGGRIHAHMTMTTEKGAFGGHLEPGTNVFTFAIVTLGVLPAGLDLSKLDDKTYR